MKRNSNKEEIYEEQSMMEINQKSSFYSQIKKKPGQFQKCQGSNMVGICKKGLDLEINKKPSQILDFRESSQMSNLREPGSVGIFYESSQEKEQSLILNYQEPSQGGIFHEASQMGRDMSSFGMFYGPSQMEKEQSFMKNLWGPVQAGMFHEPNQIDHQQYHQFGKKHEKSQIYQGEPNYDFYVSLEDAREQFLQGRPSWRGEVEIYVHKHIRNLMSKAMLKITDKNNAVEFITNYCQYWREQAYKYKESNKYYIIWTDYLESIFQIERPGKKQGMLKLYLKL